MKINQKYHTFKQTIFFLALISLFDVLASCHNKTHTPTENVTVSLPSKPVFNDGYPTTVTDVMLDSLYDFYFWVHHRDVTDRAIARFSTALKTNISDKTELMKTHRRLAVAYMMAWEQEKCKEEVDNMLELVALLPLDNMEKAKVAATESYYYYWFDIANNKGYNNIVLADSLMRIAVGNKNIQSIQMHFLKGLYAGDLGFHDKALQNIDSAFIDYAYLGIDYPSVEAWGHVLRSSVLTSNKDEDIDRAEWFFENKTWGNHPAYAYFLYSKVRLESMTNHVEINEKVDKIYINSLHKEHILRLSFLDFKFRYLVAYAYKYRAKKIVDYLLNEPKYNKAAACALAAHLYGYLNQPNKVDKYAQKTEHYLKTSNITFAKKGIIYEHVSFAYGLLSNYHDLPKYHEQAVYWGRKVDFLFEKFYGTQNMHYNGIVNFLCYQYTQLKNFDQAIYYAQKTLSSIGYNEKDKEFKRVLSLYRLAINTSSVAMVRALKYKYGKSEESYSQAETAMNLYYQSEEKLNNITQGKDNIGGRFEFLYKLHYIAIDRNLTVKKPEKAFYYAEKLKQFTFRNNINFDPKALNEPSDIFDEEKQLRAEITNLQKKVSEFGDKEGWSDQILKKQNQLHQLMLRLKTDYPKYYSMRFNYEPAKLTDIQHTIVDDSTAFIEYCVGDSAIYAFTILKDSIKTTILPKSKNFEDSIKKFRLLLSQETLTQADFIQYSSNFYDKILSGVITNLPRAIHKLIIAPDGVLSYIPFEVLTPSVCRCKIGWINP